MMANFFQSMAAFMANTMLPIYADSLGAATAVVGFVSSSFAVTALLIRPFSGPAFDSFSRKALLMIAQVIICTSCFLYGIADSVPMLIAVRLLHGVGMGCSGPLGLALVSEFLPPTKFSSGISIYTLAQSVAQVIGPASGLYLVAYVGFSNIFFVTASLLFFAMLGTAFIKEPPREYLPYRLKLDRMFAKAAVPKALTLMLLCIAFSCMTAYVVLYGYERGVTDMGLYFVVYAGCLMVTRPIFGTLADKFSAPRILLVGLGFFAACYMALCAAHDLGGFLLAAVLGSAGFGVCAPLLQSMAMASVPMQFRGAAGNTTFTGLDFGSLIGPVIGGFAVELMQPVTGSQVAAYSSMWLILLIPVAFAFIIVARRVIQDRKA